MDGKPCFCGQIVITETMYLDASFAGGPEEYISFAPATYDDIHDLASAIQSGMVGWESSSGQSCTVDANGKITLACNESFSLLFLGGSHAAASLHTILGFSTTDKASATSHQSEYQSQYSFYCEEGLRVDSYDRAQVMGGEPFVAESSRMERTTWATHYLREFHLQTIPTDRFLDGQSENTNESFDLFYRHICDGYSFKFYSDAGDIPASLEGTYCYEAQSSESMMKGRRHSPGDGYYDISLMCRLQDWE